jgi:hypothetical protein
MFQLSRRPPTPSRSRIVHKSLATMEPAEIHFRKVRKKAHELFTVVGIYPAKVGAVGCGERELIANCTIMCATNDCCKMLADLRYEWYYPESHVNCNQQNEHRRNSPTCLLFLGDLVCCHFLRRRASAATNL